MGKRKSENLDSQASKRNRKVKRNESQYSNEVSFAKLSTVFGSHLLCVKRSCAIPNTTMIFASAIAAYKVYYFLDFIVPFAN